MQADPADTLRPCFATHDGEPRLGDTLVLFMDLLGTRGARAGTESLAHLRLVRDAITHAREACLARDEADQVEMQWFSDNLALAYPLEGLKPTPRLAQLIAETSYLQLSFLHAGLLARGAITRGEFFADGTFIYGPALERAVVLEHSRAVHPRCVLDEASIALATHGLTVEDAGAAGSLWRNQLAVDPDGVVFVDYLSVAEEDPVAYGVDIHALLARHKQLIEEQLYRYDGITAIEAKYRWLAGYHNFAVQRLALHDERADPHRVTVSRTVTGFQVFTGAS